MATALHSRAKDVGLPSVMGYKSQEARRQEGWSFLAAKKKEKAEKVWRGDGKQRKKREVRVFCLVRRARVIVSPWSEEGVKRERK